MTGLDGMRRRRAAALRSVPLGQCGCRRDPLTGHHRCGGEVSGQMAEGAAAAAAHLESRGPTALFDVRTCRAMYRAGHRRLAAEMHRRATGEAS